MSSCGLEISDAAVLAALTLLAGVPPEDMGLAEGLDGVTEGVTFKGRATEEDRGISPGPIIEVTIIRTIMHWR